MMFVLKVKKVIVLAAVAAILMLSLSGCFGYGYSSDVEEKPYPGQETTQTPQQESE